MKKIHYLSGLPRSGSTLLANILAMHPEIRSTPSSPLCNIVQTMRKTWSDDSFLKAQLYKDFDLIHERLKRTTRATMQAWSAEGEETNIIDKNRGWLFCLEWLRDIDPNFKMVVTLRDLRDVYASIEKRHRKTLMLDFPDKMEHNIIDVRANSIFSDAGVVGSCLKAINNIGDIPNIVKNLFMWRYEDFIDNPQGTMDKLFLFLEVEPFKIDFNNIVQSTFEDDGFYNMKYPHVVHSKFTKPLRFDEAEISPRILQTILTKFDSYYQAYYPEIFRQKDDKLNQFYVPDVRPTEVNSDDEQMIIDLERAIKKEIQ